MGDPLGVVSERGAPPEAGGRERNEDSFLVCRDGEVLVVGDAEERRTSRQGDGMLLGVFDGMGGAASGHVASLAAARTLAKLYQPGMPKNPSRVLLRYLRQAHDTLHARTTGPDGKGTMGTTATLVWLFDHALYWAHVGDSRLYHWRAGRLSLLTEDQTRNAFLRREGRPLEPGGDHLAQAFIYGSRGLGHDAQLRLEPGRDSGCEPLEAGDRILLCSDGISGCLDAERLNDILGRDLTAESHAEALATAAIGNGSLDNVTAMVLHVGSPSDSALDMWTDDGEETVMF